MNKLVRKYRHKGFVCWDEMAAICDQVTASGNDTYNPEATRSFDNLDSFVSCGTGSSAPTNDDEISDDNSDGDADMATDIVR